MFTPFLSPWKAEERHDLGWVLQQTYLCSLKGQDLDEGDRDFLEDVWLRTGDLGRKKPTVRTSLAVQCLGLGAFTAVAQVQFLARELRSCKLHGSAKRTKQNKTCSTAIAVENSTRVRLY